MTGRLQRAIGGVYSWAAGRVYEPLVISGGFRLLGGHLIDLVTSEYRRAVAIAGGDPILDIPVGTGYFSIEPARAHGGLFAGTDYAWGMVAETKAAAGGALTPVQADIHRLPFADRSFAVICCVNGLQVIPDTRGALAELVRVLRPGGTLVISVISAPLDVLLPGPPGRRLPAVLRSGRGLAAEVQGAGLVVRSFHRCRLASVMDAVKPGRPR